MLTKINATLIPMYNLDLRKVKSLILACSKKESEAIYGFLFAFCIEGVTELMLAE